VRNPFDARIRTNNTYAFTDFTKEAADINVYTPAQM
jgi:hypothetical protein